MRKIIFLLLITTVSFAQKIPNQYIVTLNDRESSDTVIKHHKIKARHIFKHAFNGFVVNTSDITKLKKDKRVKHIEQDEKTTGDGISWGQDRIDQRNLPLDNTYKKLYTGKGVTAYIIDAGIRYDHVEFGGRAKFGYDVFGGNGSDSNGHGTHVAGTLGGTNYGVAPEVNLVSVKVLGTNNSGSVSGLIAGINWVIANHVSPSVANISIGAGLSTALNTAVANLMKAGVVTCVAAGNNTVDASTKSPSSESSAITVGATDKNDGKASYSNYGSVVDIFAPGTSIYSAYKTSPTAYVYMSGTSMASPHAAGACALILQHYPNLTALAVRDSLYNYSTKGVVTNSLSANNHLLYTLERNVFIPVPNKIPVANFSTSITGRTVKFTDSSIDSDGIIVKWSWNYGNGVSVNNQNPTYTYSAGTYTITLTVTDNQGATNSKTQTVIF